MVCFIPLPFFPVYLCANVGLQGLPATTLWGLLAVVWPALFHKPPSHWVRQPLPCCESSLPQLPVSAPPTSLDECFFFISMVVGLPYSLIFCQFWLCEEAQCVYLCRHLGSQIPSTFNSSSVAKKAAGLIGQQTCLTVFNFPLYNI